MNVIVLEDEKKVSDKIQSYVRRFFEERGESVNISAYSDAYSLLEEYQANTDVLFMDIQMNLMTGMEAAVKIREIDQRVLIVFVTNLAQYAVEGYSVNAFDFILKPVEYNSFAMKLERICNELKHRNPGNFINIKTKSGHTRLNVADILYVEVKAHDIIYHLDNKNVVVRGTLKNVSEELCKYYFSLCNSCYLVNLAHVKKATKSVVLSNGEELLISQGKRKQFMTELA
ncbi:MAG: response regulator transcription factor [Clostridia bacterium]|nr:response regulator transcription factor [Clostridia bacterium]